MVPMPDSTMLVAAAAPPESVPPRDPASPERSAAARIWSGWFLGFFLVAVGWAALVPFNQYPDEQHHVYRAAAHRRASLSRTGPSIVVGRLLTARPIRP
jgi:hypothetical protein